MFKLWWDRLMGVSGSNNFAIQFGAHCRYCFAISSKRKSVCLSRKCPKGTLNFRPFSWIVSSVELWPLCTLYRQFSWEPFTMPVSWTKVKVWKQEGISSSALAGSLLHRCKVCECSLASDCGSKKGTGLFDWSFLLCWDVEFGNGLGAEDSGCVDVWMCGSLSMKWEGWWRLGCISLYSCGRLCKHEVYGLGMRLGWHLAASLCLDPADTEGLVASTFLGMRLSWGLVASPLFLGPVHTENLVALPC